MSTIVRGVSHVQLVRLSGHRPMKFLTHPPPLNGPLLHKFDCVFQMQTNYFKRKVCHINFSGCNGHINLLIFWS